ncbi:MAG: nitrile hydratase subunit alpha [Stappiaceae bacterium]
MTHHHEEHSHSPSQGQHPHRHPNQPDEEDGKITEFRLMEIALRELLIDKALITQQELNDTYLKMDRRGPHNGARMIAKAWNDPDYLDLMRTDATEAARKLGLEPTWLNLIVVENTPTIHNVVVCTLCSCYPWPLLGLPPDWYKSRAYRSDVVRYPRKVLKEFGTTISEDVEVRVHDSSADMRYLVMPMRPAGTQGWSEEALAELVTRDSMIGATIAIAPDERRAQPS